MTYIIFTLVFAIIGGLIYRVRGGFPWPFSAPRPIEQILFCLILCAAAPLYLPFLAALTLSTLACLTGYGSYHSLSRGNPETEDNEELAWLTRLLTPKRYSVNDYRYQATGLLINGLLITLPAGVGSGSIALALCGALRPVCYEIGWRIREKRPVLAHKLAEFKILQEKNGAYSPTSFGELSFGAVTCAVAGFVFAAKVLHG